MHPDVATSKQNIGINVIATGKASDARAMFAESVQSEVQSSSARCSGPITPAPSCQSMLSGRAREGVRCTSRAPELAVC